MNFIEFLWIPSDIFRTWQISIVFPLHLASPLESSEDFLCIKIFSPHRQSKKGPIFLLLCLFFSSLCTKDWLETNFPRTWREWINWLLQQPSVLYIFRVSTVLFLKKQQNLRRYFQFGPLSKQMDEITVHQPFSFRACVRRGAFGKVWIFWEAHKNLRNLPYWLEIYFVNVQSMRKIFSSLVCFTESPNFTWHPQNSRTSRLVPLD